MWKLGTYISHMFIFFHCSMNKDYSTMDDPMYSSLKLCTADASLSVRKFDQWAEAEEIFQMPRP